MNILFVASDNNKSSGAFLSMVKLIQILKARYSIIPIVVVPKRGTGVELLANIGVKYYLVENYDWVIPLNEGNTFENLLDRQRKRKFNKSAVKRLKNIIGVENIEIVHINTSYAYIGALAARECGIPYVWHIREMLEEDQGRRIWNKNGYKLIAGASRIIAISTVVFEKYERIFKTEKLVKILNGVDIDKFYIPNHEIFQDEKVSLVYGGGYGRKKGVFCLLSALRLVIDNGIDNISLELIGEPSDSFKKAVLKYGLSSYITFCGFQEHVEKYYKHADIAFSTSVCEAFGRKTVEGMLGGALLIAADTGGTIDIIANGKTGLTYKEGNPIDLAQKITYAIKNKNEMKKIAECGRKYALDHFDASLNAKSVYEVYESVLKGV